MGVVDVTSYRMAYDIAEEGGIRPNLDRLGPLHWAGIVLAAITGAIHLYLFTTEDWLPFVLAVVGFYAAIGLLLLNVNRLYLYPLGIAYTASQIVGYLVMPLGPMWIGIVDKAVQVTLIAILAYLHYTEVMDRGERSVTGKAKAA